MAIGTLTHASPLPTGCPAAGSKKSRTISVRSNLKQQRKGKEDNCTLNFSSTHTAEVLASRLGLDIAIAGLERLFLQPGADPPDFGRSDGRRRPIRVAYQGVRGSYCHEAATASFPDVDAFPSGFRMEDAFSALESGSADRAVVPAENSVDGPIDRNLDLLLRHPAVRITGEFIVPVNHCLLAAPGVAFTDLRRIVSHPQALGHCERRLRSLDLEIEEVADAAEAARAVAEDRICDTAVIGSRIAAKEFGLWIMEQSFHDEECNFNCFLQLGVAAGNPYCGENRKTKVAFSLEKGVSGLFRALWLFESRGVRVRKVDHRPNRANPVRLVNREGGGEVVQMDYVFVVDVDGSESDPSVAAAIAGLEEISGFVRVLGSYGCRSSCA
ncbi:arogenate dehydratase/prephenate dehydratase 2, chloroplastic-like [Phalaenopsis equestris]|uniref:arogenate dehydratase/prephenate dehydratase 2, chloroplastic-like n=1 Tax=Phalaenopsis equestris TaxID=78828 RepID=UPI0009E2C958|nr:arogenate dehydratase/prephenate dehydratase 2, chloroplastic-like [Phalaenopsis equestris]